MAGLRGPDSSKDAQLLDERAVFPETVDVNIRQLDPIPAPRYCLKELPQVTIPRKIPFSLYLFMMNPDGICRHQVYSPGFHLIQLFLPSSIGNPTVMNLAHQGKPWSIVQRQKLRCIRQFRISVPLYSHVLSTSYAPADRRVCSIYYGFQQ
mgnify:CR=1 FL=1